MSGALEVLQADRKAELTGRQAGVRGVGVV